MREDEPPRSIIHSPLFWGWFISAIFAVLYFGLALAERCKLVDEEKTCNSNFFWFTQSAPNEIGDTLAGMAGVLAFLWIIVTLMLQSQELREQRKELRQARKEYAKMSAAQQNQVDILTAQGEIFLQEQKQRAEMQAQELVDELLDEIVVLFSNGFVSPFWRKEPVNEAQPWRGQSEGDFLHTWNSESESMDTLVRSYMDQLTKGIVTMEMKITTETYIELPQFSKSLEAVLEALSKISEIRNKLSEAQLVRMRKLRVFDAFEKLAEFRMDQRFWIDPDK